MLSRPSRLTCTWKWLVVFAGGCGGAPDPCPDFVPEEPAALSCPTGSASDLTAFVRVRELDGAPCERCEPDVDVELLIANPCPTALVASQTPCGTWDSFQVVDLSDTIRTAVVVDCFETHPDLEFPAETDLLLAVRSLRSLEPGLFEATAETMVGEVTRRFCVE